MIRAIGLTKHFGSIVAVDGIDLSISEPGIVGFLGPNGAGKTTTMRMLTGYLPLTDGQAQVAGFDVFEDPIEVKRRVGYLPETPPLYPELSVGEYLSFVAEIRGIGRKELWARVGEVMELVGLVGFEKRLTGSLSKGYRQRVGLAQALIHNPSLLILDEPTSGLDPAQLVGIRQLIRDLAADRTVLLSTHVLQEVEALCDRIVVICEGKIVGDGERDDLASACGLSPWWEWTVEGPDEQVTGQVAALPEVGSCELREREAGKLSLRVQGSDRVGPSLVALAVEQGWSVCSLTHHQPSLQEIFLSLVGRAAS
jgi:ABC-2 type transport system ATP-binding protein